MPSHVSPLFSFFAFLHLVYAQRLHPILVQPVDGWQPRITEAQRDDILEFHFLVSNHSVVAGDLHGDACTPAKEGGFFSGFYPVDDGESPVVFRVSVTGPEPVVFYDPNNCDKQFVGGVNIDPSALESYACAAAKVPVTDAVVPSKPFGGIISTRDLTGDPAAETPAPYGRPPQTTPTGGVVPATVTPATSPTGAGTVGTPSPTEVPAPTSSGNDGSPEASPPGPGLTDGVAHMSIGLGWVIVMGVVGVLGGQIW
ncbi:hypothetical protein OQA88_2175 [Cercophora sp. LCS_1]